MKSLIYVLDTSYKGEYSMIKQVFKELNYEVYTAIGSLDVNVNYDYEFINNIDENIVKNVDIVAIIGGYKMYYFVTGKKIPKKSMQISWNVSTLNKFIDLIFKEDKVIIAPFIVPAYIAKLGYLKGRKCTVYPVTDLINILIENGVEFVNNNIVKDGNVITLKIPLVNELIEILKQS